MSKQIVNYWGASEAGVVVAWYLDEVSALWHIGLAVCSAGDQFCMRIGRKIALGRARSGRWYRSFRTRFSSEQMDALDRALRSLTKGKRSQHEVLLRLALLDVPIGLRPAQRLLEWTRNHAGDLSLTFVDKGILIQPPAETTGGTRLCL